MTAAFAPYLYPLPHARAHGRTSQRAMLKGADMHTRGGEGGRERERERSVCERGDGGRRETRRSKHPQAPTEGCAALGVVRARPRPRRRQARGPLDPRGALRHPRQSALTSSPARGRGIRHQADKNRKLHLILANRPRRYGRVEGVFPSPLTSHNHSLWHSLLPLPLLLVHSAAALYFRARRRRPRTPMPSEAAAAFTRDPTAARTPRPPLRSAPAGPCGTPYLPPLVRRVSCLTRTLLARRGASRWCLTSLLDC